MRFHVLAYLLGNLLFYLGLVMLLPLAWAFPEGSRVVLSFVYSSAITLGTGVLLRWKRKPPEDIFIKESFTFVAFAWTGAAVMGALPFLFSGAPGNVIDAFFESMSGFTTTGATILEDIEVLPRAVLLWRSLTQWLGGMGIIALFVAMLPKLGVRSFYLLKAEVPGPGPERIVPRIAETAKRLWLVYVFISGAQFALLLSSGLSVFDSLTHTFTTMPTGGFSPYNESISAFNSLRVELIIIFFMFLAGGNFTLYYSLWQKQWRQVLKDTELRFYVLVLFISMAILTVTILPYYGSGLEALRRASFQAVSITTTTGYVTADYDAWPSLARVLLFSLMFLGGSGGSTGGAIKQIRILILLKYAYRELQKVVHPSAVIPIRLAGKVIPENMVQNIVGFNLLYIIIFLLSSLVIAALGTDFVTSLSVAASCLGNVGPALGSMGPMHTYAGLPDFGKLFLAFTMVLGRLEIYTILVFLLPEVRKQRSIL